MIALALTALVSLASTDELAERMRTLGKAGQQIEAQSLREVAQLGTRESLDALIA